VEVASHLVIRGYWLQGWLLAETPIEGEGTPIA